MTDDTTGRPRSGPPRERLDTLRTRLQRSLLWRVWERLLEIEFLDRGIALAAKAFVSFFPLVIVVAAFVPEGIRSSIVTTLSARFGVRGGDALTLVRESFASSDDIRQATGLLGLVLTIFFATSFTTALHRVYVRAWRRPSKAGPGAYWRGAVWLATMLGSMALLGALSGALDDEIGSALFPVVTLVVMSALWWFTAWFLLFGEVRMRVLVPTGAITAIALGGYAISATVWMPEVVTSNEAQFGVFGVALALVTWFSGAAICVLLGACAGSVLAEDPGWIGRRLRGGDVSVLSSGARPSLPPPVRELGLRDAFQGSEDL